MHNIIKGMRGFGIFAVLLLIATIIIFNFTPGAKADKKSFKIGLAVLKDNPDYHAGRRAFVSELEKQKDATFEFKLLDAYGDLEAYKLGLERLVNVDKVDLIFTTGTRSTLPAVEIVKDVPVVFTAVAAPVRSKIVESMEKPGGNVTGTHCAVPEYAQVKTILKVFPDIRTIGIIYTEGESNAEIQTKDFINAADQLGIKALSSTVSKECKTVEEVENATRKLVGKADVFIAHMDTSLSRYGEGMINVAKENKIPTYVSLGQLLSKGAVFSLGINFEALGVISSKQALRILKDNVSPDNIPVRTDKNYALAINVTASKEIGRKVPIKILKSASKIIK